MIGIAVRLAILVFSVTNLLFPQSGLFRSGVFLHHSTGYNYWATGTTNTVPSEIAKYNAVHGYTGGDAVTLNRQGFPTAGDNEWSTWHRLFDSPGGYGGDNVFPIIAANKIVMIKSCFPSSDMSGEGSAADTLTPTVKSAYNYKWHWRNIIRAMSEYGDNFFVIWTNNPQAKGATNYAAAQRSHRFSSWAKDTLAAGLDPVFGPFPGNVYVFDIFHKVANDSGFIPYPQYAMSYSDAHPNTAAADLVAPMIVQEVFDAAIAYEGGGLFYSYNAGWNIVSVPLIVDDYDVSYLFPNAVSGAFEFQDYYIPRDTLSNGKGYWIKFNNAQSVPMSGTTFPAETVAVSAGWNLIGTVSENVDAENVISSPPGIIISPFYGFNGSYESVAIFVPGRGYWVKVSEPGDIIIRSGL